MLRHGKDGAFKPFGLQMALQDQPPVAAAAGKGLHGKWNEQSGATAGKYIDKCEVHFPIANAIQCRNFALAMRKVWIHTA